MGQTKRVQLEIAEGEESFVRTLAGKLGWKVITSGEGEQTEKCQEQDLPEHMARLRGCLAGIDQTDAADDAGGFAGGSKEDEEDLSRYSPVIQELRRRLHTKITAEDIASDARLAYILSK